jgi:hypothetical protein
MFLPEGAGWKMTVDHLYGESYRLCSVRVCASFHLESLSGISKPVAFRRRDALASGDANGEVWQPYGVELQIPHCVDDEVSVRSFGRGCRLSPRKLSRKIALSHEMVIHAGAINRDHLICCCRSHRIYRSSCGAIISRARALTSF